MFDTSSVLEAVPRRRRWNSPFQWIVRRCGTIRGHIFIALLAINLITAALGGYATVVIDRAGLLVAKTFDQSLMSINYARAAATDFANIQAVFARRWISTDPAAQAKLDETISGLEETLADDLAIATERAQSKRAADAALHVQNAAKEWTIERRRLLEAKSDGAWEKLDRYALTVSQQIDMLINYTAGNGFTYRQIARDAVALDTKLTTVGTGLALVLSALVAWLLSQHITRPVAVASAVAKRIADGNLEGSIPQGSEDELGALLDAMKVMRDNIKVMMEREVHLRRSAQVRLADALESSREGIVVVDANGHVALANSQAAHFLGGMLEALNSDQDPFAIASGRLGKQEILPPGGDEPASEVRLSDGRWLRVSRSATQEGGYIALYSDISLQKDQEEKLKATNFFLDAALENMSQGLCLYGSDHRLKVFNRRFCEIYNLTPNALYPGIDFLHVIALSFAAGNHPAATLADLHAQEQRLIGAGATGSQLQELNGGRFIEITRQPTSEGGWVATYEDVTERRRAEDQIVFMARHDALTGLSNRIAFAGRIEEAISQIGRDAKCFAILCLDLDHFKEVNDTLGHPIGDKLLRLVAERLDACIREVDTVARLGGDEFAVLLRNLNHPDEAEVSARRIVMVLSEPYMIDTHEVSITVSIGISVAPSDGMLYDKLLKNAEVALSLAKVEARGAWRFFESEMDVRLQLRRAMESDLRNALEREEFEVFYQPLFDLRQNGICGFEALVRWFHPTRGLVSPVEFITLAEEMGLIVPLGEWMLNHACQEAMNWPSEIKVAVNVSAIQFKNNCLLQIAEAALKTSGLPAKRLELEITETVLLSKNQSTISTLHDLRDIGIGISMDDFGTGYSSLSYLRSFPFDKIKIDQSFVRTSSAKDGSRAIVSAMVALGASLGIRTSAEGVETKDQLNWLKEIGCNELQGYYFSEPVPARQIPQLFKKWGVVSALATVNAES
jgi:diguanylate cyclase (GGDEF)-like protein